MLQLGRPNFVKTGYGGGKGGKGKSKGASAARPLIDTEMSKLDHDISFTDSPLTQQGGTVNYRAQEGASPSRFCMLNSGK